MANLIKSLLLLETDHEFIVYCRRAVPDEFQSVSSHARFKICRFKNRKMCEQISIPRHANRHNLDLLHTCWCRPFLYRGRNVFNIMGLEWRTHPDVPLHSQINNWYYRTTIESTCKKADRLIAISNFMKRTFVERMNVPGEKIDIVHLGVNPDTYRAITDGDSLTNVRQKYSLPSRFILFIGALLANKNLPNLIKAFHALREEQKDCDDVALVVAGAQAWNSSPIYDLVRRLSLEKNVIFTGFVSEGDKVGLYNLASSYAFPSLVEGFGLPVLEAFACGTPVVTSNVTAMPEVAGNAALLVNPLDIEQMADALYKTLSDDALRSDLIRKGLRRAQEFTWKKAAQKTLKVYEKAHSVS